MYVHPLRYKTYRLPSGASVYLLPTDTDITSLYYSIERRVLIKNKEYTELVMGVHNSTVSWIGPGASILFSVDNKYLGNDYTLYIHFNYEWEALESGLVGHDAAQHRSYFPGFANESKVLPTCRSEKMVAPSSKSNRS